MTLMPSSLHRCLLELSDPGPWANLHAATRGNTRSEGARQATQPVGPPGLRTGLVTLTSPASQNLNIPTSWGGQGNRQGCGEGEGAEH